MILDIILAIFIVISVFNAYEQGFLRTAGRFGVSILAFAGASILSKPFTAMTKKFLISRGLQKSLESGIASAFLPEAGEAAGRGAFSSGMAQLLEGLSGKDLGGMSRELLGLINGEELLYKYLVSPLAKEIIQFISLILGFYLAYAVIRLVIFIFRTMITPLVEQNSVLSVPNRVAGAIFGLLRSLLSVFLLIILFAALSEVSDFFIKILDGSLMAEVVLSGKFMEWLLALIVKDTANIVQEGI